MYSHYCHYLSISGVDIQKQSETATGDTPLLVASQRGHHDLVKFFIDAHLDVNKTDKLGR